MLDWAGLSTQERWSQARTWSVTKKAPVPPADTHNRMPLSLPGAQERFQPQAVTLLTLQGGAAGQSETTGGLVSSRPPTTPQGRETPRG